MAHCRSFENENITKVEVRAGVLVDAIVVNDVTAGGAGGSSQALHFDPPTHVARVTTRTGKAVDWIKLEFANGESISGGGEGGTETSPLLFQRGDWLLVKEGQCAGCQVVQSVEKRAGRGRKGIPKRICLTGGPGGGKTTGGDILRREYGKKVAFVPEAATLLSTGGFPRSMDDGSLNLTLTECFQRAIYNVQINLEEAQLARYPESAALGTSVENELARYDAVIFFESAATSKHSINGTMLEGGNPARTETEAEARALDSRLRSIWSRHPHFYVIPSSDSFFKKIAHALDVFAEIVSSFEGGR